MNKKFRKKYIRKVRATTNTEFVGSNRITISVVGYSFNIIDRNLSEITILDKKTIKPLTSNKM